MLAFIIRRLLQAVIVMLTVGGLAFYMFHHLGDPINSLVGIDTPLEQREALREKLGLNDPAPIQFVRYVGRVVQGDFGLSYRMSEPVMKVFLTRLPATLELSFVAAMVALVLGVGLGVYTGLYPRHWSSRFFLTVSLVGISLPPFLIGILLILVFAVWLGWLPSFGRGDVVNLGGWSTGFLTASRSEERRVGKECRL